MRTRFFVFPVVILGLQLVRCGEGESNGGGSPQLPDVIYAGDASDEAWAVVYPRLERATVKDSLQLTTPVGTVPATPRPTFTWGAQASRAPREPGSVWPLPFGPAVALAHLPPVTGTVVLLEITGASTVRVFTDRDSWTPAAADWQAITGGKATQVTVRLYSAYLNANVIEEGPFRSPAPVSFQVEAP